MSETMEFDRIAAAQAGLVAAMVEAEPEADDGTLNVADVENAGPNEIILRGTFNTYTPAIIALHQADQCDAEQGIHRVKVDEEAVERVAFILYKQDNWDKPTAWPTGPFSDGLTLDEFKGDYIQLARPIIATLVKP